VLSAFCSAKARAASLLLVSLLVTVMFGIDTVFFKGAKPAFVLTILAEHLLVWLLAAHALGRGWLTRSVSSLGV